MSTAESWRRDEYHMKLNPKPQPLNPIFNIKIILLSGALIFPLPFKGQVNPLDPANIIKHKTDKPVWAVSLSEGTESSSAETMSFWKPIAITAAVGGITYALYAVRSR